MVYAYNSPKLKEQTTPVSIYAKDFHYGTSAISNEQFISLWSVVDKIGEKTCLWTSLWCSLDVIPVQAVEER